MARVLVVDDETGIRETLAEFLRDEGHDVGTADSVAGAKALLDGGAADVVVTDIVMPGADGMELVRILWDSAPRAKVILITGEPSFATAVEAVRLGAFDYIAKPVTQGAICRVVGSAALVKDLEDENRRYQHNLERMVETRTLQIRTYLERLRQIAEKTKELARCGEIESLAPRILALFAQNMGAEGGSFYRRCDDRLDLVVSLDPDHQPRRIDLPPRNGSVLARVIMRREGFVVRDIAEDIEFSSSGWSGYRDGSLLALPCVDADGDVSGVITLHNKREPPFTKEDLEIGRIIADHAVEAIRAIELNRRLRESEARYRTMAENSLTGIFIQEGERLVYYNARLATMLGYDADDQSWIGADYIGFIHPDDRALVREYADRRGRGERVPSQYELRLLRRDGTALWAELLASLVEHDHRPATMGTVVDLTDRKQAEERIRVLAALLDASPALITVHDLDGGFLFANQEALALYGYTLEDFMRLNQHDLAAPENGSWIDERMRTVHERGEASLETEHIRKDGTKIPLHIHVKKARWAEKDVLLSIASDMTEWKHAEEEVRKSRERLEMALDASNDGLFDWNMRDRTIYYSPRYFTMLGYEHDELPQAEQTLLDLIHPEDRSVVSRCIQEYLEGLRDRHELEYRMTMKSGSHAWILSRAKVTARDACGKPLRTTGTHVDITERKRAEEEKTRLTTQLLQSQKMEAVGRLAGGIAHDFNNILTAILGYAEIVLEKLGREHSLSCEVGEIIDAAERAAALTRQILAFSRRQLFEPRVADLGEIVLRSKRMLERIIGEDIALSVRNAPDLPRTRVDPGQIDQILVNLATNARDSMPNGGRFTIETRVVSRAADGEAGGDGEFVALIVSDDGSGMDDSVQGRIFEPFFSTKERGTGLGLSTVRDIVTRHGGRISVDSSPGRGTSFQIVLTGVGLDDPAHDTARETPLARGGTETILMVEDNDSVRGLVQTALTNLGYRVITTSDAEQALDASERHQGDIQLLLTDIVLPGMNGRELLEELAARMPKLKVLFMSGYTHDVISRQGILAEGVTLLRKPFTLNELATKVRAVLDE
ncbi:MAG: PAS domain S-box protein [Vicinamibacteria bacterium]|nr:PAS domain S-box protein [Vicinamibacteria bacterium]